MIAKKVEQHAEMLTIAPIGYIFRNAGKTYINVFPPYLPALKQIEHFSHIQVLWWCSALQGEESRTTTQNTPPYPNAPLTGVFASRSPARPNPIGLTTTSIIAVDHDAGRIEIGDIDACDYTPVVDIKAHFPAEDRVKEVRTPDWMAEWPDWMPEQGLGLEASEQPGVLLGVPQETDVFEIFQIGVVRKREGKIRLEINLPYIPALKQIEQFSHIRVLWWFHRFQDARFRRTTQCNPPYEKAPRTGVFASRSPVRPNPIGLTVATLIHVDHAAGIVEVTGIDAFDKTPILDLKPYIPCYERVKEFRVPDWVSHWREWRPEAEEITIISADDSLRPAESERLMALLRNADIPGHQCPGSKLKQAQARSQDASSQDASASFSFEPGALAQGLSDQAHILIRGARQHNLKNIDVAIPRNKFTVITGGSGSGKSSLAFDTIYAEGQRRYMESLSSLARQFLHQMAKPEVDQIRGLNPTIAIEQKTVSRNPRSTVGTMTDVHDYLRVLFTRIGLRHCPQCGRGVQPQTARQITEQLANLPPGSQFQIGSGDVLLVPRSVGDFYKQLKEAVETVLQAEHGRVPVIFDNGEEFLLTTHLECPHCQTFFFELSPSVFSFNNPEGMCADCNGLGVKLTVDPDLIVTEPEKSLLDGASPWYGELRKVKPSGNWMRSELFALADHLQVNLELPWNQLPQQFRDAALYGTGDEIISWSYDMKKRGRAISFERPVQGAVNNIQRLLQQTSSEDARKRWLQFMREHPCPMCQGERLCPEARFVTVGERRFPEVAQMTIAGLHQWATDIPRHLTQEQLAIAAEMLGQLRVRLESLLNVGLHYLTLDRPAPTLSGGEGQRLRLATQLGGGLSGLVYVLDEPSIGLHARDHRPLLDTLLRLRDAGNTVLVVEHDADTMRAADWLIDLGPGAGVLGGEIVAAGTPEAVMADTHSLTGQYLSGQLQVTAPHGRQRNRPEHWLTVRAARLHNLKNVDVRFPLSVLTCITGVSGSGKSSLVTYTLSPALTRVLQGTDHVPGPHDRLEGAEQIDKVINVTQEPIGRTPRSNPVTYIEVFDDIRSLFAKTPEAKARNYKANRFSFNSKEGQCEVCEGLGERRVEMHFLPDVWVLCPECHGKRFNRETLEITYKGKTIADVLEMDVREALAFFKGHPKIVRMLQTLHDVGLDYIKLGQSALTLSGGEAQRVKLAKELSRPDTGRTLYILDEPTTGLHFDDIQKLLNVLHRLTAAGNTVIIIEHNLDVIKTADWIIDLGPEGGDAGGYIVAEGTPEEVAQVTASYTGQYLSELL